MSHLIHLPLEKYKSRYTEYLADWELAAFTKAGMTVEQLLPKEDKQVAMNIMTGEVLDSVARPRYCFKQMVMLMRRMEGAPMSNLYFSDFFTPGLEALPYTRRKFSVSSFCWAQSWDIYDFTNSMVRWMRSWEYMAMEIYDRIFVASEGLKELMSVVAPDIETKIEVVGLPFDSKFVGKQWDKSYMHGRDFDCVYSSRWDREKNPELFLELVQSCPDLEFAIVHPFPTLRGTAVTSQLLQMIEGLPNLTVLLDITKPEYYAVLNCSRVQFNSSFQDWISFTLLEALTYDCLPLYPNFRSFPETFQYDQRFLYAPSDAGNAALKLRYLLESDTKPPQHILEYNNGTLSRIAEKIG